MKLLLAPLLEDSQYHMSDSNFLLSGSGIVLRKTLWLFWKATTNCDFTVVILVVSKLLDGLLL